MRNTGKLKSYIRVHIYINISQLGFESTSIEAVVAQWKTNDLAVNSSQKFGRKWNKNRLLKYPHTATHTYFPHFPFLNSGGIECGVAELNAALCPKTRANKWKYEIFRFLEWISNPQPVAFKVTLVLLRHVWPLIKILMLYFFFSVMWCYYSWRITVFAVCCILEYTTY